MRIEHQLRAFDNILSIYDGKLPLHRFLLTYFKQHKQMGSSDRRWANRYVYAYYRLGIALPNEERNVRMAIGDFLCNNTPSLAQATYLPEFIGKEMLSLDQKIDLVKAKFGDFKLQAVFPWQELLSKSIDIEAFQKAHFVQPDLFIRANRVVKDRIAELLEKEAIPFDELGPQTLGMPNATKLDKLVPENYYYKVQDFSSQKTIEFLDPSKYSNWWDCCAASGGKSLLLHELEPTVQLLVSDVRESVLFNLNERFQKAGIVKYQKKMIDLLQNNDQILHDYAFDGIILDAPCTGSGTWCRTPEMLSLFSPGKIAVYTKLQRAFAANIVKYLKPGKPLIYITCSVFEEENEAAVAYMIKNLPLKLEKMEVIKGYNDRADTMFAARLIKTDA